MLLKVLLLAIALSVANAGLAHFVLQFTLACQNTEGAFNVCQGTAPSGSLRTVLGADGKTTFSAVPDPSGVNATVHVVSINDAHEVTYTAAGNLTFGGGHALQFQGKGQLIGNGDSAVSAGTFEVTGGSGAFADTRGTLVQSTPVASAPYFTSTFVIDVVPAAGGKKKGY
eukprot:TRINITY_DN1255_c0_g1_i3.p2 TRINITY_DN1255_c0_g1~~TRINITY_DN1255_c0_g1_i3.p2  ORF type:complete len:170 (-),score=36.52 TRINITY_DN1255_c0_g1_i3:90-599(-)